MESKKVDSKSLIALACLAGATLGALMGFAATSKKDENKYSHGD